MKTEKGFSCFSIESLISTTTPSSPHHPKHAQTVKPLKDGGDDVTDQKLTRMSRDMYQSPGFQCSRHRGRCTILLSPVL